MEDSKLYKQLTQKIVTVTQNEDKNSVEQHNVALIQVKKVEMKTTLLDKHSFKDDTQISNRPQNEKTTKLSSLESNVMQYIKSQEKFQNIKNCKDNYSSSDLSSPSTSSACHESNSSKSLYQESSPSTSYRKLKSQIKYETDSSSKVTYRKRKSSTCSTKQSENEVPVLVKKRKNKSNNIEEECLLESEKGSGSEYVPSESDLDSEDEDYVPRKSPTPRIYSKSVAKIRKAKDDGDIINYKNRNKKIVTDKNSDKKLDYDLRVPYSVWSKLYQYQKIGVKWMNELNHQKVGGLLGDEMGLGKTVQVIAFLAALDYSKTTFSGIKNRLGPCLITCPATIMHQWVKHFHEWWPPLRVVILHQSGCFKGRPNDLIREINKDGGILLTTYQGMLKYNKLLCELNWHYVILDEGHKIRNPTAKVTEAVKHLRTPHRLILTGSPMQNNLTELWSLFDFIVPGKLGTLQVFMDHFATPILQGGYANASPFQEATALSIATALKNVITPYMLRRAKVDVKIDLPDKSEQVLFCELTNEQTDLYKHYLMTEHVGTILSKDHRLSNNQFRAKMLMAVTALRKICNHPDLYLGEVEEDAPGISKLPKDIPIEERFGYFKRAGKMKVVAALLKMWQRQGHRVLLFTQTRAMIELFEEFLNQNEYKYLKMDGTTSIGSRQPLIDQFNNNSEYFLFLLTTRVGGLGINLTGADRVIIYDPDWNPATDIQARERAWRIGQKKNVTVYRLLSAGTIEEKIYQRQIWKQLLSNKVLTDAKQKRFFKLSDLHELFSLQEPTPNGNIETLNIFQDSKVHLSKLETSIQLFSEEKLQAMKDLAQKLAKKMTTSSAVADTSKIETKTSQQIQDCEKSVNTSTEDENFIWDPQTIRFRKMRKIILPPDPVEKNFVDEKETNTSFNDILGKLDTCESLDVNLEEKTKTSVTECDNDRNTQEEKSLDISTDEKVLENQSNEVESTVLCGNNLERTKKCDLKGDKNFKSLKKVRHKSDNVIDGEMIKGVVKKEGSTKVLRNENNNLNEKQDAYVLQQLFSKGVHTALKHDSIVRSGYEEKHSLKDRIEAERRAKNALKILKSTRLRKWRW